MNSYTPPTPEAQDFKIVGVPVINDSITYLEGNALDVFGNQKWSTVKIMLPEDLIITNTNIYEFCPTSFLGNTVTAEGPKIVGGFQVYRLTGSTKWVRKISENCEYSLVEVQSGAGSVGPKGQKGNAATAQSGLKGSQGDKGTKGGKGEIGGKGVKGNKGSLGSTGGSGAKGAKGADGEQGAAGSKGSEGSKGPKGTKGSDGAQGPIGDKGTAGSQGAKGAKGSDGEGLDWNTTQQSIYIGSKKFGPRLFGVCQNGSYEYVYIFASDPE